MGLRKRTIDGFALRDRPFYAARLDSGGLPRPWSIDELEDFAAEHDSPFAGRALPGVEPSVSLQVEATGEPPVWVGLDGRELGRWSGGLAAMWRRWGTAPGETIAFFDYGSSPLVLLASASYVAWLRLGAADRLGLTAICNDGVASMAARMVVILEHVAPSMLVVRRDLLTPFADALRTAGFEPGLRTGRRREGVRWIAVTEPEGLPAGRDVEPFAKEWEVPLRRVLRSDAACLLAGDCVRCGLVHLDRRLHAVRELGGELTFSNRFARTCPTIGYRLGPGELVRGGCPADPRADRLALD